MAPEYRISEFELSIVEATSDSMRAAAAAANRGSFGGEVQLAALVAPLASAAACTVPGRNTTYRRGKVGGESLTRKEPFQHL